MTYPPFAKREQNRAKAFTVRSELILRAQDSLVIDGALQDPGLFELS